jgi:hypothetical protein
MSNVPGGATASGRSARRTELDRVVEIGWRLEINVLTARPDRAIAIGTAPSPSSPVGGEWSPGSIVPPLAASGGLLSPPDGETAGGDDGHWQRILLAFGHVITAAKAELVVASNLWRFGMELDFSETSPTVTSDAEGVTAFVASEAGMNLLARAVAPLKAADGVKLTPQVAPGGVLSRAAVQQFNLPPLRVRDLLLTDAQDNPVLCLCAELGAAAAGVARLVQPVLERQDFAYAVSTDVLAPALKARWRVAAGGLSVVSEIPIELPVSEDSDETETGRAQLRISFSDTLDDVSIRAGTDNRGDPLRLMSQERIQLLNLWKHNGEQVTDLGSLGEPQNEVFVLPLCLFDRTPSAPQQLQPNFKELLLRLIAVVVMPIVQPFPVGRDSVSGFSSSAMKAMLLRWSLKSIHDDIRPPIGGAVEGRF